MIGRKDKKTMSKPSRTPQYWYGGPKKIIGDNMFGVILWSDRKKNRAVIWCEDHGNLAFYNGDCTCPMDDFAMDPGDLVQFDLLEDQKMRLATNPRLVASDEYPTLARDLKDAGLGATSFKDPPAPLPNQTSSAKILTFEQRDEQPDDVRPPARKAI